MSEIADRYRNVAGEFTKRVVAVPATAWDDPSPCEGWVARDVVRHLVEWVPSFLTDGASVDMPVIPSVDNDPVAAWRVLDAALQALVDDPESSQRTFHNPHTGTHRLDDAIGMFVLGDVLVHTWDVARAACLDETLDRDEVQRMLAGVEPLGDVLAQSGQYGPRVPVSDGADEQTRLLACTGRDPAASRSHS